MPSPFGYPITNERGERQPFPYFVQKRTLDFPIRLV